MTDQETSMPIDPRSTARAGDTRPDLVLLRGAPEWARGFGIGVTGLGMLLQIGWLPAHPVWSVFVVVLEVVLYALVATCKLGTGAGHAVGGPR